jgi:hypothetical protein
MHVIQHCPSDSTVSEDVRIEPRTVTDLALTPRRSNHSARSRPQYGMYERVFKTIVYFILLGVYGKHVQRYNIR